MMRTKVKRRPAGWWSRADIGASVGAARSECQLRAFLSHQPWHAVAHPEIEIVVFEWCDLRPRRLLYCSAPLAWGC
jgi:hypothetical protein